MTTSGEREVDAYLAEVPEPGRATLEALRATMAALVPDATQCLSYRMPAFRLPGGVVGGFAAFSTHLSYIPFSGSVLGALSDQLEGYERTKSSLHFDPADGLPDDLVAALLRARRAEIEERGR